MACTARHLHAFVECFTPAMKIILLSEQSIRLESGDAALTIEAPSRERAYSPFDMLASSLAVCTFSVMSSWATQARLASGELAIEVGWTFAEDPHRVGAMELTFEWPSLSPERLSAAERVATMCSVHATLLRPPPLTIRAKSARDLATTAKDVA